MMIAGCMSLTFNSSLFVISAAFIMCWLAVNENGERAMAPSFRLSPISPTLV